MFSKFVGFYSSLGRRPSFCDNLLLFMAIYEEIRIKLDIYWGFVDGFWFSWFSWVSSLLLSDLKFLVNSLSSNKGFRDHWPPYFKMDFIYETTWKNWDNQWQRFKLVNWWASKQTNLGEPFHSSFSLLFRIIFAINVMSTVE